MIPREKLDEILGRIDIVSLVSEYVPLKKMGQNFKGLCPFHGEKTPSFMVSQEKQIFHCFGCSEGGNAFGFLMKMEKYSFPEAVKKLAEMAGVDLPTDGKTEDTTSRDEKEALFKVNRYASWFFTDNLKKAGSEKIQAYLAQRKISEKTIEEFKLGFAPDSWEGLIRFFQVKQIPLHYAEMLGLAKKRKEGSPKGGSHYDFFRNRLIFPIMDAEARVIGFSGRRLDDNSEESKYINSAESPIYHKGNSIYGLAQAKTALREKGETILVEGNVDLIRLSQEGIKNVAAPLGTALTLPQIRTLKRFAEKFVLLFDGDAAGMKAMLRAIPLFFEAGYHPRVVELLEGDDPDSFVKIHGAGPLSQKIADAPLAMEWILLRHLTNVGGKPSQKIEAAQKILPFLQMLPSSLEKKSYTARLSQFLGISDKDLEGLEKLPKEKSRYETSTTQERQQTQSLQALRGGTVSQKISLERILLQLYVKDPHAMEGLLGGEVFSRFEDEGLKNLGAKLKEQYQQTGNVAPERFLSQEENPEVNNLLSELALVGESWSEKELFQKMALDCVFQWKKKQLHNELKQITNEIQLAEFKDDQKLLTELISRKNEVTKVLSSLKQIL